MRERGNILKGWRRSVHGVYAGFPKTMRKFRSAIPLPLKNYVENLSLPDAEQAFLRNWPANRNTDLRSGFTNSGPHRDDFEIMLDGFSAGYTAPKDSREAQSLALKLAEAELLSDFTGETPLCCWTTS